MNALKAKAISQIMGMLDEKDVEGLKKHSPKLVAVSVKAKDEDGTDADAKPDEDSPLKDIPPELLKSLLSDGEAGDEPDGDEAAKDESEATQLADEDEDEDKKGKLRR